MNSISAVSLVCCTFGRTRLLPLVVESFKRQDYTGSMELVIVNDCPKQKIFCDVPNVKIFNVGRYSTLGSKRNGSFSAAKNEWVITVDDDDIFLPWFVSDMVAAMNKTDTPCGWIDGHFYAEGMSPKIRMTPLAGTLPSVYCVSKTAMLKIGYFKDLNCGEDRELLDRAEALYGNKTRLPKNNRTYGYVYRWANGVYHISGNPKADGWTIAADVLERDIQDGIEPTGEVIITPKWDVDYIKLANSALVSHGWPKE